MQRLHPLTQEVPMKRSLVLSTVAFLALGASLPAVLPGLGVGVAHAQDRDKKEERRVLKLSLIHI